jgi:hypothetical protein
MHIAGSLSRRKAQVFDQERQVDPEPLCRLDAASGTRMA